MASEPPLGAIAQVMQELGKLPGIGPKTAERLTHFLLAADRGQVLALSDALRAIKEQIKRCRQCCNQPGSLERSREAGRGRNE